MSYEDILYSTGKYSQHFTVPVNGILKNCESLLYTWNLQNTVNQLYLNKKKIVKYVGVSRRKCQEEQKDL